MSKESLITYDKDHVLGQGGFAFVFRGTFWKANEDIPIPVAVKRVQFVPGDVSPIDDREEEAMMKLIHENVVRLLHVENQNDSFRCYALELCDASLDRIFLDDDDPKKYRGPLPPPASALLQLAQGLEYIHSKKVIHRDIKPQNVLIASSKWPVTLKWADFGLSKSVDSQGNHSISDIKGTLHWMAPEVLALLAKDENLSKIKGTIASDVFSSGCLFFCYLTNGSHPFGSITDRLNNIKEGQLVNLSKLDKKHFAYTIIKKMLVKQPEKRPSVSDVIQKLQHPNEILCREFFLELAKLLRNNPTEEKLAKFLNRIRSPDFSGNWKDANGGTTLHYMCLYYKRENLVDIVQLLIEKGTDVTCKTPDRWTALHTLCRYYTNDNLIDIVRLLADKGVDVDCKNSDGWTALHIVSRHYPHNNLIDIIRLLVEKGADVNCKTSDGRTPVHYLCEYYPHSNLIDIVRLLVGKGADVNCKLPDGWTALHYLCLNYDHDNLIDIVRVLLENGADVRCKNSIGRTALHYLCEKYTKDNLIDIVRLLVNYEM